MLGRWSSIAVGRRRVAAILTLIVALLGGADTSAAQAPPNFTNTVVASVSSPTALAFTPDGRLLVASQNGQLRVIENGSLLTQPALSLVSICPDWERGLLGVAVDPQFGSNGFIYLYYTFRNGGTCVNRVSRFVLSSTSQVNPATEVVLIDNIPSPAGNHNAGDVQFGRDGYLYISVGDGGCDYAGGGCGGGNDASRDPHVLVGKILRIARDGSIPPTNPYLGSDSSRCNVTGRTTAGRKCQETFASGLRNPFRIAFDPNASGTRFFINDVGQEAEEEINLGQAGADYGWNQVEGNCSGSECSLPGLTNPIHAYSRGAGCTSITGGAFVPNGVWPAAYDNVYLFADYACGQMFTLTYDGASYTRGTFVTGFGFSSVTTMTFGPYNGTQALYYASYANGGQVRRIHYSGTVNRAPIASMTANPRSGVTPLTVAFDGRSSSDPDGGALTFDWDFGDGSPHGTASTASHTYSTSGLFTARLTVRDPQGLSGTTSVTIDAGNRAPAVTITSPTSTTGFRVGDTIRLEAQANDPEDGALPASSLRWTVIRHHASHTHPFFPATAGNGLTFQFPGPEDFGAAGNSYLELSVTATDSRGLSTTIRQDLRPAVVNLTFATEPAGLRLEVNGLALTGPQTVASWQNDPLTLNAPAQTDTSGQGWVFQSWSNGQPSQHTTTTPASAASFTATFVRGTVMPPGLVAAYTFNEGTGTAVGDISGRGHTGTVAGASWIAGKFGQALAFDGVDDRVTVNDAPALDLTTGMTLEAWVYPTAHGAARWRNVLIKERPNGEVYNLYSNTDSNRPGVVVVPAAQTGSWVSARGTGELPLNTWSHLAATYDGATLRFFVNGLETGSTPLTGGLLTSDGALRIGGNSIWGEYFEGRIDDLRIYNRALTATEIANDMKSELGNPGPPAPPTGLRIVR